MSSCLHNFNCYNFSWDYTASYCDSVAIYCSLALTDHFFLFCLCGGVTTRTNGKKQSGNMRLYALEVWVAMILRIATTAISLALFLQSVEGVIAVNASDVHNDYTVCYIYGNCCCPSMHNALANLTSNVLINITTYVELASIIPLINLANITITGHNNPTVNCNNSRRYTLFTSCYNCRIEGHCGSRYTNNDENVYPVLYLLNSSNIAIKIVHFNTQEYQQLYC